MISLTRFRRLRLYATEETMDLERGTTGPKVLLAGGFGGCWNFGDIIQLEAAIGWHRHRGAEIVNVIALTNIRSPEDLARIRRAFDAPRLLLFGKQRPSPALKLVEADQLPGVETLHFYGGGILNSFWAQARLPVLDCILERYRPRQYIISGQQIESALVPAVLAHIGKRRPRLVGCRDHESVDALRAAGVQALYSGDDAWERFCEIRECAQAGPHAVTKRQRSFALHLGLPPHIYRDPRSSEPEESRFRHALEAVNAALRTLRRDYGDVAPLLINGYMDSRDLLDTGSSLRKTVFAECFPRAAVLDLPALLLNKRLEPALRQFLAEDELDLYLGTYYHPTLLFKFLRVPSLLCAFNAFYRQKALGLGQPPIGPGEFLAADKSAWLEQQEQHLQRVGALRREWLDRLAELR